MKVCSKCREAKPLNNFGPAKKSPDGLNCYCSPCNRAHAAAWRSANRQRSAAARAAWAAANPRKMLEYLASWAERKAEIETTYRRSKAAKQRVEKLQRTLALTPAQEAAIKAIYAEAKRVSEKTKILHHVDHIVPLQGKEMSGLHVPWNLEVVPARQNLAKSNKVDYSRALPTCMERADA
jgi:5-methylcytosine-specific restriction endonuclease McrA